jgi:hypothetical protein
MKRGRERKAPRFDIHYLETDVMLECLQTVMLTYSSTNALGSMIAYALWHETQSGLTTTLCPPGNVQRH